MICPNCGRNNAESYRFCMQCGSPLQEKQTVETFEPAPAVEQAINVDLAPDGTLAETPSAGSPISSRQEAPVARPSLQQQWQPQPQPIRIPSPEGASGLSLLSIWRPFAGYGARRRHVGWLMDNRGDKARELMEKVGGKFQNRAIPDSLFMPQTLVAKGLVVERRPYFILKRGLVSVGLHIAAFGNDLFVSLASYLKPPISYFRVALLGAMFLFWMYMSYGFPNAVQREMNTLINSITGIFNAAPADTGALMSLLCLVGPLGTINTIALFLFVVFSVYKFFAEKDLLAGLRVTPNEFNEDDLMAMEKAVEQTVRQSLDEIGLDPDDLVPAGSFSGDRII